MYIKSYRGVIDSIENKLLRFTIFIAYMEPVSGTNTKPLLVYYHTPIQTILRKWSGSYILIHGNAINQWCSLENCKIVGMLVKYYLVAPRGCFCLVPKVNIFFFFNKYADLGSFDNFFTLVWISDNLDSFNSWPNFEVLEYFNFEQNSEVPDWFRKLVQILKTVQILKIGSPNVREIENLRWWLLYWTWRSLVVLVPQIDVIKMTYSFEIQWRSDQ